MTRPTRGGPGFCISGRGNRRERALSPTGRACVGVVSDHEDRRRMGRGAVMWNGWACQHDTPISITIVQLVSERLASTPPTNEGTSNDLRAWVTATPGPVRWEGVPTRSQGVPLVVPRGGPGTPGTRDVIGGWGDGA